MSHFQHVWGVYDTWQQIAFVSLAVCTLAQTIFVGIYSRRPWRVDPVGRAIMLKSASFGALLWLSLVNTFFAYNFESPISCIAVILITAAVVYQLAVLVTTPSRIHPDPEGLEEIEETV